MICGPRLSKGKLQSVAGNANKGIPGELIGTVFAKHGLINFDKLYSPVLA